MTPTFDLEKKNDSGEYNYVYVQNVNDNIAMPSKIIYIYYIKLESENDSKYRLLYSGSSNNIKLADYTDGIYSPNTIKVEVKDPLGNVSISEIHNITGAGSGGTGK